jgi:Protein of unknown function (DUF4232)
MTEPRDPFEEWLTGEPVEPLAPPPGAFDRIARSAQRRRWTRLAGTAATVLVVLTGLAAGIGSLRGFVHGADSQPTLTAPGPPTTAPITQPIDPPTSTSAGPPTGSSAPTTVGSPRCSTGRLQITVVAGDNAAGHIGLRIVFTNASTSACTMYGYPGVSFRTAAGAQINDPATRAGGPPATVRLAAHGTAHADLLLVNVANYPPDICKPVQAAGVTVYPPDETTAIFAATAQQICTVKGTGLPVIYPTQPGT